MTYKVRAVIEFPFADPEEETLDALLTNIKFNLPASFDEITLVEWSIEPNVSAEDD